MPELRNLPVKLIQDASPLLAGLCAVCTLASVLFLAQKTRHVEHVTSGICHLRKLAVPFLQHHLFEDVIRQGICQYLVGVCLAFCRNPLSFGICFGFFNRILILNLLFFIGQLGVLLVRYSLVVAFLKIRPADHDFPYENNILPVFIVQ